MKQLTHHYIITWLSTAQIVVLFFSWNKGLSNTFYLGATTGQQRDTGLSSNLAHTVWMQPFETCITEISICSHSGWNYLCSVTSVRWQWWEVLMRTRLLLCNERHGARIVPVVSPLHTRLIRISPSCWTIFRSFEIILEWELPTTLEFKFNFPWKPISSKNIQSVMKNIWKSCRGQLGL